MRDLEFHTELRRAARGVPEGQRHMRCDSRRLRVRLGRGRRQVGASVSGRSPGCVPRHGGWE